MKPLPAIMVAPNGARLQKSDHPAVPITQDETVACAKACFAAGATGIHAHLRDDHGGHLLDATAYRALLKALRAAVPQMDVQITTEAAGRYGPQHQMEVALDSGADLVSVAIREISRAGVTEARAFFETCTARGIAVQHILYDATDGTLLEQVLGPADIRSPELQLMYVLGRYKNGTPAEPADLAPFLDWHTGLGLSPDWACCAFGSKEPACLLAAAAQGGKCRVGFENSRTLSDGTTAADNAAKVHDLVNLLAAMA